MLVEGGVFPPPSQLLIYLQSYVSQADFFEAEDQGRNRRNVNDAATNERTAVDNLHDGGAAVVEIEHFHLSSHREGLMRRNQAAEIWILII